MRFSRVRPVKVPTMPCFRISSKMKNVAGRRVKPRMELIAPPQFRPSRQLMVYNKSCTTQRLEKKLDDKFQQIETVAVWTGAILFGYLCYRATSSWGQLIMQK